MICDQGLYFQHTSENGFFGKVVSAIHIYHNGSVAILNNRRNSSPKTYDSVQEFAEAHPVIMFEILGWCREHGKNFDAYLASDETNVVPISKKCKRCGKTKPIGEFPKRDLAFDGTHDDCCQCRIVECTRIKAYCTAPVKDECATCPVREVKK